MEPTDTLKQVFADMDDEARTTSIVGAAVYAFLVLLGCRRLANTPDERLQGPRWLWRILMPSSAVNVQKSGMTVIPVGVVLFWLLGRKRG